MRPWYIIAALLAIAGVALVVFLVTRNPVAGSASDTTSERGTASSYVAGIGAGLTGAATAIADAAEG